MQEKRVVITFPAWLKERMSDETLKDVEHWANRVYADIHQAVIKDKGEVISALELSIAASILEEYGIYLDDVLSEGYKKHYEKKDAVHKPRPEGLEIFLSDK